MLNEFVAALQEFGPMLLPETGRTLAMIFIPTFVAYLIGLPLGVLLFVTRPNSMRPMPILNAIIGWIVNMGRSIPFIILLIVLIPVSRVIVGTAIGYIGVLPPLAICTIPFVARMVEQSIEEVDSGMIEAARAYGASIRQTITTVIIPESLPSIMRGLSITLIAVFGYAAMAGAIGAGGLGDMAIRYGYYRHEPMVMFIAIVLSIVLIQVIQSACDFLVAKVDKRNR